MANTNREKLFTEFPAVSTEQWEEVITKDLKGADYERKLVWRTPEGFSVRPYYRAENLEGLKFLGTQPGEFPYVRGVSRENNWLVYQTIDVEDCRKANAEALHLLDTGVDALGFNITTDTFSAEDLAALLDGIVVPAIEISFGGKKTMHVAAVVMDYIEKSGLKPDEARINFLCDPIVKKYSQRGVFCHGDSAHCLDKLAALAERTRAYGNIRVVSVGGELFGNSGSTIVEELAFSLAAAHEYLVRLMDSGLSVDDAARKIRFSTSITSNYFMEMAKIRAARLLWANIVKAYEPQRECSCKMRLHGVTSAWNQTVYDPYVNMLRGTTEAMSAAIAGIHSLEVLPFDTAYETPDDFSKRIAHNVELLLKHEAHFDQVTDPAGGSYYIENLTASIAEQAWKLFLEVEDKGGYIAAFESGFIVERVKASAAAKDKNIMTRRLTLLGANQFPNFSEVASDAVAFDKVTRDEGEGNVLRPYRGAMAFEAMRMSVDRSGKAPKAFMLTCGNLAMARARAQFSCNFFACAGIKVIDNTFFSSVEEGVAAAVEAKADIVVVCSSDDDYAALAPEAKRLLGDRAILVVAGAPACTEELQAQGITNFISVKSNVLETLKFYLKELGI